MNESTIGTHVSFIFRGYFTHILGCKTFIKGKNYVFFFFFCNFASFKLFEDVFWRTSWCFSPTAPCELFFFGGHPEILSGMKISAAIYFSMRMFVHRSVVGC